MAIKKAEHRAGDVPLSQTFTGTAGAVIEITGISLVALPKQHICAFKGGILERPALESGVPIKGPKAIDNTSIHQVTCKFDRARNPGIGVGLVNWTHVKLPAFETLVVKAAFGTIIIRTGGQSFSWFVEPAGRVNRTSSPGIAPTVGRLNAIIVIRDVHVVAQSQLLQVVHALGTVRFLFCFGQSGQKQGSKD